MKHVEQLGPEQGSHWMQHPKKLQRWLHPSTDQALLRVGKFSETPSTSAATFNVARLLIGYARYNGENPPGHANTCQFTECVNPTHWVPIRLERVKFPHLLEARGPAVVVTRGGLMLPKDALLSVVKHDGPVHLMRVLVDPYGQTLQILCGAQIDLEYVVLDANADCVRCLR